MPHKKILVVGTGNILMADEGFGPSMIKELAKEVLPAGVELLDAGTAGLDSAVLSDKYDKAVIIDTIKAGGSAGDMYRFRPQDIKQKKPLELSLHQASLIDSINMLKITEDAPKDIIILAVEPRDLSMKMGLSETLKGKIPEMKRLVMEEIKK